MPSQIAQTANGLFVWIDQPFEDDALRWLDVHLPPLAPDAPVFVFLNRGGSGDMESFFYDIYSRGYNVKFRGMNPGDAKKIDRLNLPTHNLEWPGHG